MGKGQVLLPNRFKKYKVELYKSNRIKTKSKFWNDCQIVQQKWSNYMKKSKGDNSHLPSTSLFPSTNKEIKIQKYFDKNKQYSSYVQHQQKIGG
jgi:hypothetical protein